MRKASCLRRSLRAVSARFRRGSWRSAACNLHSFSLHSLLRSVNVNGGKQVQPTALRGMLSCLLALFLFVLVGYVKVM